MAGFVIKLLAKTAVLPLLAVLLAIQAVMLFLLHFASRIYNIFAGIVVTISLAAGLLEIAAWPEVLRMVGISFCFFFIPYAGEWLTALLTNASLGLHDFLSS